MTPQRLAEIRLSLTVGVYAVPADLARELLAEVVRLEMLIDYWMISSGHMAETKASLGAEVERLHRATAAIMERDRRAQETLAGLRGMK